MVPVYREYGGRPDHRWVFSSPEESGYVELLYHTRARGTLVFLDDVSTISPSSELGTGDAIVPTALL